MYVLALCGQNNRLHDSVGGEVDTGFESGKRLATFGQCCLHEYEYGIFAADFNVLEHVAVDAVHIQAETVGVIAGKTDVAYRQLL